MSYYVSTDDHDGRDARRRMPPAVRGAHARFTRLEALESRLLFNTGLDPLFGTGGRSRIDIAHLADTATAVHVLADGKLLIAGNAAYGLSPDLHPVERAYVARLNADGSLDAAFGTAGIATYPDPHPAGALPGAASPVLTRAQALAVAPDGRIFVGGTAPNPAATSAHDAAFAVAAFTAAGAADTTFGHHGVAVADMALQASADDAEWVHELLVQGDGRIVAVGGIGNVSSGGSMVGIVRFDPSGARDATFAPRLETFGTGPALPGPALPASALPATAAVLQEDGRIVLADRRGSTGGSFVIHRYHADGTPDLSFGGEGSTVAPVNRGFEELWVAPGPAGICDVLVQPDGKILAAGRASATEIILFRYQPDGSIDLSFGGDGSVIAATGPLSDVDLQFVPADGGFWLAAIGNYGLLRADPAASGQPVPGAPAGFQAYVGRFNAAGDLISSARMDGSERVGAEQVAVVSLLPDGKLLAAGVSHPTQYAGEGPAWDQTADALVVRFDPATFPSGQAPPPPPAPPPIPNHGFSGKPIVTRGRSYPFKLSFRSVEEARATPVGVYGPAGLVGAAKLLKVRMMKIRILSLDVRPAIAIYRAPAPGGKFDAGDNGQYAVRLGTAAAEPLGDLLGQFTVAARAPRVASKAGRQITGVLQSDLRRVDGPAPSWRLERPRGGVLALDMAAVVPIAEQFAGQRVTVAGSFRTVLAGLPDRGRKQRVFVVTSIRAAAP